MNERPTIAELFEAAGYGRPGNDIDEVIREALTEIPHLETTIIRLGDKLTGVVNALRGEPPDDTLWSTHDAPELAKAALRRITRLRQAALRYRRLFYKCMKVGDNSGQIILRLRARVAELEKQLQVTEWKGG